MNRLAKAPAKKQMAPQIEYLPIADLRPDSRNPRRHGRDQLMRLSESMQAFGFNAPILIDETNKIIAGHARREAALISGLEHVPVLRLSHLNERQAKAYMLADNQLAARSTWDDTALAVHLKELSELNLEFGMEATGFELPEIDVHLQSLIEPDAGDRDDDFELAKGASVIRPGDVWHLGDHRILCGDALNPSAVSDLLAGEKASAVFTDPPYNVPIRGHASGKGARQYPDFKLASGEMTEQAFSDFLAAAFRILADHTEPGAIVFACMDWRQADEVSYARRKAGFEPVNICAWIKSNGGMGSLYRSQHEFVHVFKIGSGRHRNNVQLGRFGRNRTNVWHYAGANSFARRNRQHGLDFHPTSKPVAMVADAIRDVTARGDIVFDPFLGAGATIPAAERMGRRGFGVEIEPSYVETTINRWQAMTKRQARRTDGLELKQIQSHDDSL